MTDSTYAWQAHPARERPVAAAFALGVMAASAGAAGLVGGLWWGVLAAAVLLLALSRFLLPSRFAIDDEGITARYPFGRQRFRWRDVRRLHVDAYGGYLSTRAEPSRLDAYRGMHLLFGTSRDEALRHIRRHMESRSEQGAVPCAG